MAKKFVKKELGAVAIGYLERGAGGVAGTAVRKVLADKVNAIPRAIHGTVLSALAIGVEYFSPNPHIDRVAQGIQTVAFIDQVSQIMPDQVRANLGLSGLAGPESESGDDLSLPDYQTAKELAERLSGGADYEDDSEDLRPDFELMINQGGAGGGGGAAARQVAQAPISGMDESWPPATQVAPVS